MMEDSAPPSAAPAEEVESQGGVLLARAKAQEQQRMQLWKSRVGLIKQARSMMQQKMFSEAAVAYEKYIKILEIVFNCKKGETLTPEHFKESARTSELTVIVSVYWDLLRIYDSSSKYGDRQHKAAEQLAKFVRFTPIFADIVRKAETFSKSAKHPQPFKHFLKLSNQERPRCFVATSAFEYPCAPEVQVLREFRDLHLKSHFWGRKFVFFYYQISPRIACLLDKHPALKPPVRVVLRALIKCVS